MQTNITNISGASYYPVSAVYEHDSYITLKPEALQSSDGFKFYNHPMFTTTKDVVFNRSTQFVLTSAASTLDVLEDTPYSNMNSGEYVTITLGTGTLIAHTDNKLYVSAVSVDDARASFRLIVNDDSSVSFLHGTGLYATVNTTLPFSITLDPQLDRSEVLRQQFKLNTFPNNKAHIISQIENPTSFGPSQFDRFWSCSNQTSAIQSIGVVLDDDYTTRHDYVFTFSSLDSAYTSSGLTKDTTWVQYFNSISSGDASRDTTIQTSITAVPVGKLVSIPYKSGISGDTARVNIMQLKSVLTPESNVFRKS